MKMDIFTPKVDANDSDLASMERFFHKTPNGYFYTVSDIHPPKHSDSDIMVINIYNGERINVGTFTIPTKVEHTQMGKFESSATGTIIEGITINRSQPLIDEIDRIIGEQLPDQLD